MITGAYVRGVARFESDGLLHDATHRYCSMLSRVFLSSFGTIRRSSRTVLVWMRTCRAQLRRSVCRGVL